MVLNFFDDSIFRLVKSEKKETETEEIKKFNLLDRFTENFISSVCKHHFVA